MSKKKKKTMTMKGSHGEVRSKLHVANMEDRIFWSWGGGAPEDGSRAGP